MDFRKILDFWNPVIARYVGHMAWVKDEVKQARRAQSQPEGPLPRSRAPEGPLDFYLRIEDSET